MTARQDRSEKRLKPWERHDLVVLWLTGESAYVLGKRFGMTYWGVLKCLRTHSGCEEVHIVRNTKFKRRPDKRFKEKIPFETYKHLVLR